jgi:hypothetical protein
MSKIIEILALMGQEANIDIENLLAKTDININQSKAILNKDVTALERQLDICPDIKCFIIPAENDEPSDEEESENDTTSTAIGF